MLYHQYLYLYLYTLYTTYYSVVIAIITVHLHPLTRPKRESLAKLATKERPTTET